MNGVRAPLYVEAHELALWLEHTLTHPSEGRAALEADVRQHGRAFLYDVAEALSFPHRRAAALERADTALVRLRVGLELAVALGRVTPRQVRHVSARIERAGRMLGGWQRARRRPRTADKKQGTTPEVPIA